MRRHTTNRAKNDVSEMKQKTTPESHAQQQRESDVFASCSVSPLQWVTANELQKIFENLPRVFLRKNPGANSPKTKPTKDNAGRNVSVTKENRKDAQAA